MKVRIRFASEIFIDGANMGDIVSKFCNSYFYNEESEDVPEFIEVETVEDANNYSDLSSEFMSIWK